MRKILLCLVPFFLLTGCDQHRKANAPLTDCDILAADPDDPYRKADGVALDNIDVGRALYACQVAVARYPDTPRLRYQLGRVLYHQAVEQGIADDDPHALDQAQDEWRKAAEAGYAAAQRELGRGGNEAQAAVWFGKAVEQFRKDAEKGNAAAQTALGRMYSDGWGVPKDYVQAAFWLRKAADQGLADAQGRLSILYKEGEGVSQDCAQALFWLHKAAGRGDGWAAWNLGYMHERGECAPKDYAQAASWYRKANARSDLARMREKLGEPEDAVQRAARLRREVERSPNAGELYDLSRLAQQGDVPAFKALHNLAEQGNSRAQGALGRMYEKGLGVPRDISLAVAWYRKAADRDGFDVPYHLGRLYEEGDGVPKDMIQAIVWYGKAAQHGKYEAVERLSAAAQQGNAQALTALNSAGAPERGNLQASEALGVLYEKGSGVPQDYAQAAVWYRKAAEQGERYEGYPDAEIALGRLYEGGLGLPQDYAQAAKWYIRAAEHETRDDTTEALDRLSALAARNTAALEALRNWAEQGDFLGQYALGRMYEEGRGVPKDTAQAVEWYRKSAAQGSGFAKEKLRELEKTQHQ